nr:transposase [Shewanella sp. 10N.286.48.A6]
MNKKDIEAFAKEAAKSIKTPEDLNQFSQMLKKITVEAALNAEMDDHLGYSVPNCYYSYCYCCASMV